MLSTEANFKPTCCASSPSITRLVLLCTVYDPTGHTTDGSIATSFPSSPTDGHTLGQNVEIQAETFVLTRCRLSFLYSPPGKGHHFFRWVASRWWRTAMADMENSLYTIYHSKLLSKMSHMSISKVKSQECAPTFIVARTFGAKQKIFCTLVDQPSSRLRSASTLILPNKGGGTSDLETLTARGVKNK